MPSRIVREGILSSLAIDRLSSGAELFYRRVLNIVDDFGRYHGTPALLRAAAYPLKIDKVQDSHITTWVNECVKAGLIAHYTVDGLPYIEVQKFGTPRAKESKFPQPCADENKCKQTQTDESNRTVVVVESVVVGETTLPRSRGGYTDDFEDWWKHHPRKIEKPNAFREWKKLSADQKAKARDYIEAYREAWETYDPGGERRGFCPYPERWLKRHRWEDDINEWILEARGK